MLRRMLGKKKGKMVTFLGGIGYCYNGPMGSCADWERTSCRLYTGPSSYIDLKVGDQIDPSTVFEHWVDELQCSIAFNCTKVYGSGVCLTSSSTPPFKYAGGVVKYRILSDFYCDYAAKYGDTHIRGTIEVLPEYQA